jgi:hypothetical protein
MISTHYFSSSLLAMTFPKNCTKAHVILQGGDVDPSPEFNLLFAGPLPSPLHIVVVKAVVSTTSSSTFFLCSTRKRVTSILSAQSSSRSSKGSSTQLPSRTTMPSSAQRFTRSSTGNGRAQFALPRRRCAGS